ncbi:alpha/beta hydrolase [Streptomyces iranensis]|nr:alpha/beta hydrolase [Streptomyces iranensis]
MDYATLKSLKPSEFEDAAGGYKTVGDMASQAKDDVENQIIAGMRQTVDGQAVLEGEAAEAAVAQLRKLATNFHYTQVECALIATALNSLAYELRAAKDKLDAAVEDAEAEKFTVGADGSVSYPAGGDEVDGKVPEGGTVTGSAKGKPTNQPIDPTGDANDAADALERQAANIHPNPNFGRAVAVANRIAQAVHDATQTDEKWAPKLRKLKADDDLRVSRYDWTDAQSDTSGVRSGAKDYLDDIKNPPKDGSPKDNAKWWKGLSGQEKADYAAMYPAGLGKLDGIPADVRDEANRIDLAEKRADYQIRLDAIPKEPTKFRDLGPNATAYTQEWLDWHHKYEGEKKRLEGAVKGMNAIQDRFDQTGRKGLPEAYLLGFSPEGRGRAIVANGNPDTADHTAVYVPGTTSNLSKIHGDINRMTNLWHASEPLAPGQKVSTITWLGYDAPQNIVTDATRPGYANTGAPAFNQFVDGLNASNESGTDSHVTAIGHSYGSTLIGSAARQGDLNADDIIFAGSPGVQVGSAEDLDVPKGHVWNEYADGDPVPELGRAFHGGDKSGRFWHDADMPIIPADAEFGAHQMTTDTEGHSGYWDYDLDHEDSSQSLLNQANVVVGRHDKAQISD